MIKNKMIELVSKWNIKTGRYCYNDIELEKLKELNSIHGDGYKWCSYEKCLEGIIKNSVKEEAFKLYSEHYRKDGARNTLSDFLRITDNFDL